MKKLKIFLMLGILLCFGFALSSEVHAQGGGPKIFEVNDVLPATTQLRISWIDDIFYAFPDYVAILTNNDMNAIIYADSDGTVRIYTDYLNSILIVDGEEGDFVFPYTNYDGNHPYCDIDTTSWDINFRTISSVGDGMDVFTWEDLNAPSGYSITFEEYGGTTISDIEDATELPTPLPPTTKSGYTFGGWYYDDDFTTQAYAGDELEDDVTLYAKWILNTYTITFEEYGGTSVTDLTEQTALPDPLPIPTKENHVFVGWYYDSDFFNEDKAFAGDPLTDDVTLYARWLPGKLFEEDEVLPATTQLKIRILFGQGDYHVETDDRSGIYLSIDEIDGDLDLYVEFGGLVRHDGVTSADKIYYTIDISNWSSSQRTIKSVSSDNGIFVIWEDLNAPTEPSSGYTITFEEYGGTTQTDLTEQTVLPDPLPTPTKEGYTFVGWYYDSDFFDEDKAFAGDPLTDDVTLYARWLQGKVFEVDEVLPATTQLKIRILFGQGDYHVETDDRSGIYLSIDEIDGDLDLYVEFGGLVRHDGVTSADKIYYTIDISNWSSSQRTIKSVSSENGCIVTWEDANPDGYTQGFLTAREEFGYYDSRTNQWLSVEEYLDLYGTDKPGQSDFYGNFDKYFIPAMIIVFGAAIVLTILKVFKGRE